MSTFNHKDSMKRGGAFILLIGALLCVSSSAFASEEHEHAHGDILLTVDEVTGELAIGSVANQTIINEQYSDMKAKTCKESSQRSG